MPTGRTTSARRRWTGAGWNAGKTASRAGPGRLAMTIAVTAARTRMTTAPVARAIAIATIIDRGKMAHGNEGEGRSASAPVRGRPAVNDGPTPEKPRERG